MGWGNAKKAGVLQPTKDTRLTKTFERGQQTLPVASATATRKSSLVRDRSREGSLSPNKKRARFALDQGIREPGRESMGAVHEVHDDDDDDELDIV